MRSSGFPAVDRDLLFVPLGFRLRALSAWSLSPASDCFIFRPAREDVFACDAWVGAEKVGFFAAGFAPSDLALWMESRLGEDFEVGFGFERVVGAADVVEVDAGVALPAVWSEAREPLLRRLVRGGSPSKGA